MKRFIAFLICLFYAVLLLYLFFSHNIQNYLAPQMHISILFSSLFLILLSINQLFSKDKGVFKLFDLVLFVPFIIFFLSGDGRFTLDLAEQKTFLKQEEKGMVVTPRDNTEQEVKEEENLQAEYDESSIYFDVVDENYSSLANYISYSPKAKEYSGKIVRLKGFSVLHATYLPSNMAAIGRYSITCCAADSEFEGFFVYKDERIKRNSWYEVVGVLEPSKDQFGYDIMVLKIIHLKEIDGNQEKPYIYPCYNYGDGSCSEVSKYHLEY